MKTIIAQDLLKRLDNSYLNVATKLIPVDITGFTSGRTISVFNHDGLQVVVAVVTFADQISIDNDTVDWFRIVAIADKTFKF